MVRIWNKYFIEIEIIIIKIMKGVRGLLANIKDVFTPKCNWKKQKN